MIALNHFVIRGLCILAVALPLAGCFPKYIAYPTLEGMLDKQGRESFTAWTLEQTDARVVLRALGILRDRALKRRGEAAQMMESYRLVMQQLDQGWPGLDADIYVEPGETIRDHVMKMSYESLAISTTHELAPRALRRTYLALRPLESQQPQYGDWLRYGREYGLLHEETR